MTVHSHRNYDWLGPSSFPSDAAASLEIRKYPTPYLTWLSFPCGRPPAVFPFSEPCSEAGTVVPVTCHCRHRVHSQLMSRPSSPVTLTQIMDT